MASWGRLGVPVLLLLALALVAAVVVGVRVWRSRPHRRARVVVGAAAVFALVVSAAVTQMEPPGAAVIGWSLVWSMPMLPYRALGGPLDPDVAFGFALVLSLAANVVTVVATAYVGLFATGRRTVGLAAAGLFAFWPLLVGVIGGERAWGNGTWAVDAGLVMYTEPLSTALCAVALALLLSRPSDVRLASAGVLLSLATAVKLSNAVLIAAALVILAWRLRRRALPFLGGALAFVPLVLVYWSKGYAELRDDPAYWPDRPFSTDYLLTSWTDSLLFQPRTLLLLAPLALAGLVVVARSRLLMVSWIVPNALFYSAFFFTWQHPRFLFVSLPALFVLEAAGVAAVVSGARRVRTL
jgi:hypothetical protein